MLTKADWSSYDRTWFSGPDKQEILILTKADNIKKHVMREARLSRLQNVFSPTT
jgi:hypothetical protein